MNRREFAKIIGKTTVGIGLSAPLLSLGACGGDNAADLMGTVMPNIEVKSLNGESFNLAHINSPAIIHFFGLWCAPCLKDEENWNEVIRLFEKYKGIKVLAIHTGEAPKSFGSIEKWYAKQPKDLQIPVVYDSNAKIASMISIPGYPSTLVVDATGKIVDHSWAFKSKRGARLFVRRVTDWFNMN